MVRDVRYATVVYRGCLYSLFIPCTKNLQVLCYFRNPCLNGGSCSNNNGVCSCSCLTGYSGQFCQTLDICGVKTPCLCGQCINDPTAPYGFRCNCPNGYYGPRCERRNIIIILFLLYELNVSIILEYNCLDSGKLFE